MAENPESGSPTDATTTTKKVVINPRSEIDTSPPFESVKEAVDRFGGSGPWIPHHLLRLAGVHHDDADVEEQAEKLERDLTIKEKETLNVLKELEATRRFVEDLKLNMAPPQPEMSSFMAVELNQAKLNLNKTSVSLAVIQASVDSLNQKLRRDKGLLQIQKQPLPSSYLTLPADRRSENGEEKLELNRAGYEAEQFKKMTEASRYEVMKAMAEIEQTKNSIKMAEMRLNAAKKMEEAAKAVEAIAIAAQTNGQDSSDDLSQNGNGITLSLKDYRALTQKAKQADELELELCSKTKFIDQLETPVMEKFEEKESRKWSGSNETKFKFRNSHSGRLKENPTRSTAPIGDVLSRKFIVQDDMMVGRHVENRSERQHVSLSQMLRKQNRVVLNNNPKATREEGNNNNSNVEKQHLFFQRKKIGFIQVPIPTKKKGQSPVNPR